MKLRYLRTDFPNSDRSHILIRDMSYPNPELVHFVMVLSNRGTLWVDVFWPFDLDAERHTRHISEEQFWETFRKWRLDGMKLGDSEVVANALARKQMEHQLARAKEQKI